MTLQLRLQRAFNEEEHTGMTTQDFIIALFYAVDKEMLDVSKRSDAKLYPSEVVTLACCLPSKGEGPGPSTAG